MAQILLDPFKITVNTNKAKDRFVIEVRKRGGAPDFGYLLQMRTSVPVEGNTMTDLLLLHSRRIEAKMIADETAQSTQSTQSTN